MPYNSNILRLLDSKNIQTTAIRILVLQNFFGEKRALSLQNLATKLHFSDRTTLYRTLKTFQEKGLIHQINDGTPSSKYALCDVSCSAHNHSDLHPHFHCENCKTTSCLNSVSIPSIYLNKDFNINSTELILKGVCDLCNKVA